MQLNDDINATLNSRSRVLYTLEESGGGSCRIWANIFMDDKLVSKTVIMSNTINRVLDFIEYGPTDGAL